MRFFDANPFVRQALVGNLDKSNIYDVNTKIRTVDSRLFYIISGGGNMTIEGVSYPIMPGTAVLFSAGTEYVWETESTKYYAVNFDYTDGHSHIKKTFHPIHSDVFDEGQITERPCFEDENFFNKPAILQGVHSLEPIIAQITTEYCIGGDRCDELLSSLMKAAIITVMRTAESQIRTKESVSDVPVRRIISYINMNYGMPISNEDIAARFNFHSTYLNRVFRADTGESIHAFLIKRRINAAMEMLRSESLPIGEVAKKCGFNSLYHFTKAFKKRVGMTPSEYRRLDK